MTQNSFSILSNEPGRIILKNVATYDIAAQVKYGTSTLDEAGYHTLMKKLKSQGGDGGVIGIDKYGKVVIHFNTVAMPRGYINSEGETSQFNFFIFVFHFSIFHNDAIAPVVGLLGHFTTSIICNLIEKR